MVHNQAVANGVFAGDGSGLFVDATVARFTHVTLAGNGGALGDGLRIRSDSAARSVVEITNTIVASQSIGFYAEPNTGTSANGILWFSTPVTTQGWAGSSP